MIGGKGDRYHQDGLLLGLGDDIGSGWGEPFRSLRPNFALPSQGPFVTQPIFM